MNEQFKQFAKNITDEIEQYSTIEYGCVGMEYLHILAIKDDKIISIGSFPYYCWRSDSNSDEVWSVLKQLGKEAQEYLNGERSKKPGASYYENILILR